MHSLQVMEWVGREASALGLDSWTVGCAYLSDQGGATSVARSETLRFGHLCVNNNYKCSVFDA